MRLISHRGNINGPEEQLENHPDQIKKVISQGYDVEIDLRLVDNKLCLGHDFPEHEITESFIKKYSQNIWVHCKNFNALNWLITQHDINFFWHQDDDFTLTSNGYIWTYPGKDVHENSIIVQLVHPEEDMPLPNNIYGVCSDFISFYQK